MATALKPPDLNNDSDNAAQDHFDKEFAGITAPGHMAKEGKPGDKSGGAANGSDPTSGALNATQKASKQLQDTARNAALKGVKAANPEAAAALEAWGKIKSALGGTPTRKKASTATIVATVVAGVTLLGFLAVLPDELISLMENLEQHFFAKVEYDINKEAQKEVSSYLQKRVLKRLGAGCKSSDEACASDKANSTDGNAETPEADPIEGKGALFDNLDDADFAKKLADHGFTFAESGGKIFLHAEGLPGGKLDLTNFMSDEGANLFDLPEMTESGVSDALQTALNEILPANGVYEHENLTKLINQDDGDKFCLDDCETSDQAQANDEAKTSAAVEDKTAAALNNSDTLAAGTAVEDSVVCMADTSCDPTARQTSNAGGQQGASNDQQAGQPQSTYDKTVQTDLGSVPSPDLTSLPAQEKSAEALAEKGTEEATANAAADKMAETAADGAAAENVEAEASSTLAEKLSPIGWVLAASQAIQFLSGADVKLAAFTYKIHTVASIRKFVPFAASASEQKSGHTVARMDNSVIGGALHNGNKNAEASPYVERAIDSSHNPQADTATVHTYLQNGHMLFNDSANIVSTASRVANDIPGFNWLADLASLVNKIVGWATAPINFLISKLFGLTGIDKLLSLAIGPLLQLAANYLFPLPNLINPDGETAGTLAAEGTSSTASLVGTAIGGKHLTTHESARLVDAQNTINFRQFQQESFFARMFDTSTPYSLISKLALDIPSNTYGGLVRASFASLLRNPVNAITSSLAGTFRLPSVFAATAAQDTAEDPSGIISTGVPIDDPVFKDNAGGVPENYWQANNCGPQALQDYPDWNNSAKIDPNTGQSVYDTTNGCLTVQRAAQALGVMAGAPQAQ